MKKLYFIAIIVFFNTEAFSQFTCIESITPQQNLNKYWEYRERLKNFVAIGIDSGCSIPSTSRSGATLNYGDEPAIMGYYIGMLAMEYHLLDKQSNDSASLQQKQRCATELHYALLAVDRIDNDAEAYWTQYYNNSSFNIANGSLNGFLIRDDVDAGFTNQFAEGDLVENDLNKSLSNMYTETGRDEVWYSAKHINSALTDAENGLKGNYFFGLPCSLQWGKRGGPGSISIDEITQLYIGLALVSKFIPYSLSEGTFPDLETSITQEAINISNRIFHWQQPSLSNPLSTIINPVTGDCGAGMIFHQSVYHLEQVYDPCKCNQGGSDVGGLIRRFEQGLFSANYAISHNFNSFFPALLNARWGFLYKQFYFNNDNEFQILSLASIGHIWLINGAKAIENLSFQSEIDRNAPGRCTIYPLLYQVLWDLAANQFPYNAEYYRDLLNAAPCHGTIGFNHNIDWEGGDRVFYGHLWKDTTNSGNYYGLDYLFLFNLFNIAYPLMQSNNNYVQYHYVSPKTLREPYLIKSGYTESDEKNFWAADSIKAGRFMISKDSSNYTIKNDNDPNQPMPYKRAQVSFRAGQRIDLMPGFEADSGVLFDATIDTSIHVMDCLSCADPLGIDNQFFPPDTVSNFPWLSTDSIKVCNEHCINIQFVGINGDTTGIKTWRWNFGNGDTSDLYNPTATFCPSNNFDTSTRLFDTAFQVTLIVTSDTGNYSDTLISFVYLYCSDAERHLSRKIKNDKKQSDTIQDFTKFEVLNNVTKGNSQIIYYLPQAEPVTLTVFDLYGNKISTLTQTSQNAGYYSIPLNNSQIPAGIYFVRMEAGDFVQTKKLVVIK